MIEIFRCRSCYHKARPGCPMCSYWVDVAEKNPERIANARACECCGFVSNVPELVARHRCES